MSDTSAINAALNQVRYGVGEKAGHGDTNAINAALANIAHAATTAAYDMPYVPTYTAPPKDATAQAQTPAVTAPTVPTQALAAPTTPQPTNQQGGIIGMLQGAAQGILGLNAQNMENQQAGIQMAQGAGITDPAASGVIGTALGAGQSLLQAGAGLAGILGGGLNNIPGVEQAGKVAADVAGQYNENIGNPVAGLGLTLTKLTDPALLEGRLAGNFVEQFNDKKPGFDVGSYLNAAFQPALPSEKIVTDTQATIQKIVGDLQKGKTFESVMTDALLLVRNYGADQFDKAPIGEQLVAGLVFDPLNVLPGAGLGDAARLAKIEAATKSIGRVEEAGKLLEQSRWLTPAAKVVETVKGAVDNLIARTWLAEDAAKFFDKFHAFANAGDAEGFAKAVGKIANFDSMQGNRAAKLLSGFAPDVVKLQGAHNIAEAVLAGTEDAAKLSKNYRTVVEGVKAGTHTAEDVLELTKAEATLAAQKYMAKQAADLFPLAKRTGLVAVGDRLLNEVRSLEAVLYIGMSPVTWVRNWVNNKATGILEGVSPLWNVAEELRFLRKAGRGDAALDLERAISMHKQMSKTSGIVRQAVGIAQTAGAGMAGDLGQFGGFMSKFAQKFPGLKWYQSIESAERARVWAHGYWRAMQNFSEGKWLPKLSAEAEAVLSQYRVNPSDLYGVLRDVAMQGGKEGDYIKAVDAFLNGRRATIDFGGLAQELSTKWGTPINEQELRAFMQNGDEGKLADLQQRILERVQAGEDNAQVVSEEVARTLTEIKDGLVVKTGGVPDSQLQARLSDLGQQEQDLGDELLQLQGSKSKLKKARREELRGMLDAIDSERTQLQEALGYTNEEMLFGRNPTMPEPPKGARVYTPENMPPPKETAPVTPIDENPLPPQDLPTAQLTEGQQAAQTYLLSVKRADGSPVYTAEQLATWKPDTLERIAGEMQTARATFDRVMKTASERGVATATEKGRPNNRFLLNVLNKHKPEGAERFVTIADVRDRADEALAILDNYVPDGAKVIPAPAVAKTPAELVTEIKTLTEPDPAAVKIASMDEAAKAHAAFQADVLETLAEIWAREEMKTYRLGTDAQNRVAAWMRTQVLPSVADAHTAATMHANDLVDKVLLNYDRQTKFDAVTNLITPFSTFRNHYAAETIRRVVDRPAMLAWYLDLKNGFDTIKGDPNYPKRLRNTPFFIPLPFLPKWMGGGMFFDPVEQFAPIESVFGLNSYAQSQQVTDDDVAQSIRAMAKHGEISVTEASNAIANGEKDGLWNQVKQQMEEAGKPDDSFASLFKPHLPVDIAWKALSGRGDQIGVLFPFTRLIRAGTSFAPAGSMLNPTGGGINIEQPIKAGLRALTGADNIPDWDLWEQYRTDRAIADLVGAGTINERDALLALIERKGPAWDMALQQAAQQGGAQAISLFGGQLFPQGEREYYRAMMVRNQLLDQSVAQLGGNPATMSNSEKWDIVRANGLTKKGTPLGDIYDKFPVLSARSNVYDQPETRLKSFLTDEMWWKYTALSALDKRSVKGQIGKDFGDFISNQQRDYSKVSLEQMGEWVRRLRGYVPQQSIAKIGDAPGVQYATADQSARYQKFLDQKDALFNKDQLNSELDLYGQLATTADKQAFKATHPLTASYLSWYGAFMRANPDISKIINPDFQAHASSTLNQRYTENQISKLAVSNLTKLVRNIGDNGRARHGGGGSSYRPTVPFSLSLLNSRQRQVLSILKQNPRYRIPKDVNGSLYALWKKYGRGMNAPSFAVFLQLIAQM